MSKGSSFSALHQALCDRYDLEELRTLCADLAVDFDSLRGEGKSAKGRELILWLQRHGRLGELDQILNAGRAGSSISPTDTTSKYNIHIEHAEGLVIGDQAQIIHSGRAPTKRLPSVSYSLLTRYLPTAYCRQLTTEQFPFVTITVDNTAQDSTGVDIQAEAVIEGYSNTASWSLSVPESKVERFSLLPILRPEQVATLDEIRPATLHITIVQVSNENRTLLDRTERIYLHARNTALLAVRTSDNGDIVDLCDYLAGWVTPHQPVIEKFLRRAAEHHPEQRFLGYQGAFDWMKERHRIVRAQAQAIFDALKAEAQIRYINSIMALGGHDGQIIQRVRLPSEVLAISGSANCLDAAVLFASLLELAGIDPLLVLVPGHAFVGWRVWEGEDNYEFVETLMISNETFDAAQEAAQQRYEGALEMGFFTRSLFNPGGFARVVDVVTCHKRGIHPLE